KTDRLSRLNWLEGLSKEAEKNPAAIKRRINGAAQGIGAFDPKNIALKQEIALKDLRSTREELSRVTAQLNQLQLQVKHSDVTQARAVAQVAVVASAQSAFQAAALATVQPAIQAEAGKASRLPEQMIEEVINKDAAVAKLREAISKAEAELVQTR